MSNRAERTFFCEWWGTVDRWLLFLFATLMIAGFLFGLAAYPPVAAKLGLSTFHFVNRQAVFLTISAIIIILLSFLSTKQACNFAIILFFGAFTLIILTLFFGIEIKGARRWINLPFISLQPSEILKPAFVVIVAWALSRRYYNRGNLSIIMAFLLLPMVVIPLIRQPDLGQTILVTIVWGGLFFLAGLHILWVAGFITIGTGGLFLAYHFLPHVTDRIDRFLNKGNGDTFQTDMALESFSSGGWFGVGPGEGIVKRSLPDSHTDFIFSVIGEEFGAIMSIFLICIYCLIVCRIFAIAMKDYDPLSRMASAGLGMLFGLQSFINIAVNLNLIPPKGMTLPFLSYGGSSLFSIAITVGLLLAFTRKRPGANMIGKSDFNKSTYQ